MFISHIYVSGFFVNFFYYFWVYLGINTFSQRISKIYGNWRFDVVLSLEFQVKNWQTYTKQLPTRDLGCPFGRVQLSGGVPKQEPITIAPVQNYSFFNPFLKPLKITHKFTSRPNFRATSCARELATELTKKEKTCCVKYWKLVKTAKYRWAYLSKYFFVRNKIAPGYLKKFEWKRSVD